MTKIEDEQIHVIEHPEVLKIPKGKRSASENALLKWMLEDGLEEEDLEDEILEE